MRGLQVTEKTQLKNYGLAPFIPSEYKADILDSRAGSGLYQLF